VTPDNPEFILPVEKQTFDVLISYHGLEKALDPERLLLELRKYLVKDGLFISMTYNIGHVSTIINLFKQGWIPTEDGALKEGNIRHFSYDSLKDLLVLSGFEMTGEDIYGFSEAPELTNSLIQITRNPYLNALSFIVRSKRVEAFPFIEGTYP
ncbi:MAG: methyltransferase domain-containing protein, partial [Candidatus Sericytochromatia bacterium]|nr:methyltransferase domain-containing protein [Candidatus Sericytochromatia bacterium]